MTQPALKTVHHSENSHSPIGPVPRPGPLSTLQAYGVCLAMFLEGLSSSSINVQVAAVRADFRPSETLLQLIASGFLVAYAGLLIPAGRLADRVGRRRVFLSGLGLFAVGSVLGAFAPGAEVLAAARIVQGAGAAVSAPAALALVTQGLDRGGLRNRRVALYGAMGAVGFSAGLVVPGLVVAIAGWRSSFAIVLPCVLAIVMLAWTVPGAVVAAAPADRSQRGRGFLRMVLGAPQVRIAAVALACAFGGVLSSIYLLTLALQDWHGLNAFVTGLLVLPQPLCFALLSWLGAHWAGTRGWRAPLLAGLALITVAIAGLGVASPAFDGRPTVLIVVVLLTMAMVGTGLAWLFPACSIAAVNAVPEAVRGSTSAVLTTAQNLGGTAGISLVTALALIPSDAVPGSLLVAMLVPAALVGLGGVVVSACRAGAADRWARR